MNCMQRVALTHKTWLAVLASAFIVAVAPGEGVAQKYPEKTVRIVTPFGPGGGTDIFARILAQRLSETLGQQFVVENRPGAGSTLGTEYVAKAPADGYTLLMTSASFAFSPGLYPKLRYDSIKDFAQVSLVVSVPHVIVVLPSLPVSNLQDFVRLARARPGEVLYASSGPGSAMHLAGALFATVTRTQLTHVPYKGGAATATAVLGGEATTAFNTIETVLPLIRAKRLRALAVSTRERSPALPDVPTALEAGIKNYEALGWFGLMAPAGTAQAIVGQLSGEITKAMATPAI
ncbi:MAG: tripartite tricarboxylate transporter substrate binding protein, partial [Pseudomonadota bacterium]